MALTRKRAIYIASEGSNANYAVDPDADGSDYAWVPTLSVGDFSDEREMLATDYFTGRPHRTAMIPGADGCSITFTTPLIGLATPAGDGVSPPADDWLSVLLAHCFDVVDRPGEGLASGADADSIVLDSDLANFTQEDARPIFESNVPSASRARSQWIIVDTDNASATYEVSPNFVSNPTTAAIMYGGEVYTYHSSDEGGFTLSIVLVEDDVQRTLHGGRCTALKLSAQKNQIVTLEWTFSFDGYSVTTKASLPAAGDGPAITPIRSVLNPVFFGTSGTMANMGHVQNIEIDWQFQATPLDSVNGTENGRAGWRLSALDPKVTINPPRTTAAYDLAIDGDVGRLLVQLGRGQLSNRTAASTAWDITSNVLTVTLPEGHRFREGMYATFDTLTAGGDMATPTQVESVTPTSAVFAWVASDGSATEAGTLASVPVLNTCAFTASQAQATKVQVQDDGGYLRNAIEFMCSDAGGSGRLFQLIRS